jgi:hypothetical protein
MKLSPTHGLAVLAAAAAVAGGWWTFNRPAASALAREDARARAHLSAEPAPSPSGGGMPLPRPTGPVADARSTAAQVAALEDLAWEDDADSLKAILAELASPQAEVRAAALAATRSFGSRDAVPTLREISARTKDSAERRALEETADYLELPSLSERAAAGGE